MLQARIISLHDKKVILKLEGLAVDLGETEDISFKFNVGTEVFFVKTTVKKFLNQYYFDLSAPVVELKRRQQVRYVIPKKWKQNIVIAGSLKNNVPVAAVVLDLSLTGLRIEVLEAEIPFKVDQFIEVQFNIHQRAAITCQTLVRFLKSTPGKASILGLEFLSLTPAQQEKVRSLIDDLKNYIAINKS